MAVGAEAVAWRERPRCHRARGLQQQKSQLVTRTVASGVLDPDPQGAFAKQIRTAFFCTYEERNEELEWRLGLGV